jgi:hypothetical protein
VIRGKYYWCHMEFVDQIVLNHFLKECTCP